MSLASPIEPVTAGSRPAPTLRRTWTMVAVGFVALVVALGVLLLGSLWFQRTAFDETTSRLDAEVQMGIDLRTASLEYSTAMLGVLYLTEFTDEVPALIAEYARTQKAITERVAEAREVMKGDEAARVIDELEDALQQTDAGVRAAPELFATGTVAEAFAEMRDPFADTVWKPYEAVDPLLSELATTSVVALREQVAETADTEQAIRIVAIAAMAVALAVCGLGARRMRRRVLRPVAELRAAAIELRDSHLESPVCLQGAAAELHDLADTLNETATWLRRSHTLLREQADTDVLTGLPNRKAFNESLRAMLAAGDHDHVAVLFIDLDDFKIVNDSLGHAAGDELLQIVARRLRSVVRDDEVVARLGGDEFAMILGCADRSQAVAVAERTLAAIDQRVTINDTSVSVGCSIGIAMGSSGDTDDVADELLRNADFAMYMAKSQGKNCLDVFAPSMYTEMRSHIDLKRDLDQAVDLDQYVLHYQPVLDRASGALVGFEALIRWQHPERGLLPPAEFIPVAEDTGAIVRIGEWVIDRACAELALRRAAQGADERPLWMSVNVAAQQLTTGLVSTVTAALVSHAVPADALVLEITESTAVMNTTEASDVLHELRRLGTHVALDDFGTGFSSLRHLGELPVDVIKIDRAFIADGRPASTMLLQSIVDLGRSLGLQIIAEGIENDEELARVDAVGQLAVQGYLFAHPLPAADAAEFQQSYLARHTASAV